MHLSIRCITIALCAAMWLPIMAGCGSDESGKDLVSSGVALRVDFLADTDVAGVRIQVDRVACPGDDTIYRFTKTVEVPLEDMFLPSAPSYPDNPFVPESGHLFGDAFLWLAAGCYDVNVQPITAQGEPSADCGPAAAESVWVVNDAVTEITLAMQCEGPPAGGLDTTGTLNHPPVIDLVTYTPSKFVLMCEPATVCAYASDPDNDPLEIVWSVDVPYTVVAVENEPGYAMSCIEVIVEEEGTVNLTVTVYDLYPGGRIEELVAPETSHDSATLPLHVAWCDPAVCCGVVEPEEGCTLTQGYWKNHEEDWDIPPDTELCGSTWLQILFACPDHGNAWITLAHQWIAARLNVANGASTTPEVLEALANPFIDACMVAPEDREIALAYAATLDDYNNGVIGPGHCEDSCLVMLREVCW